MKFFFFYIFMDNQRSNATNLMAAAGRRRASDWDRWRHLSVDTGSLCRISPPVNPAKPVNSYSYTIITYKAE